ncbi:hypothetical protein [Algoriphagus halophytocola]|uniref:Outer membrane protein beta-barrel domain-containing protein n=1 Tax=Algoriphagus halophytocola TaxID=2991499 RepID=A0ABY6MMI1_9BACT|nr:hypothetical protein [Algoriphagus sp. TR-M5]UZD24194.1 hypothetical protein OM944_06770 [Algoriphagus sp. TR-M5]
MKKIKPLLFIAMFFCFCQQGMPQTVNWNALEDSKHIITAGIGWDYSVSFSLGYAYQLKTNTPILLTSNFSIPSGEKLLDDFKTKIGGQVVFWNRSHLKGSIALNGIYRRFENPLVQLQNFGSELKGVLGFYKPKWFVAAEVGFDKAIVSDFTHSDTFKDTIFTTVKDGWYKPSSGGNFMYGLQTGYSSKQSDLTLNIGMVTTQDFKTTPLVPYYLMLGYNLRLH